MQQGAAHPPDCGIAAQRNFHVPVLVPFLCRAEEVFVTVLYPFHRPLQDGRAQGNDHLFRVAHQLRPEAAADLGGDDAHTVVIAAEQVADYPFYPVGALRGSPQCQVIGGGVMARDCAPAFYGMSASPVQAEGLPESEVRVQEGVFRISVVELKCGSQVVGEFPVHGRTACTQGRTAIGHDIQGFIINFHQVCRVFRRVAGTGNHHCDRFARIDHFVSGQYCGLDIKTKAPAWQPCGHPGTGKPGLQVRQGMDSHYSRCLCSFLRVGPVNQRVAVRAAHKGGAQCSGQLQVVNKTGAAR